MAHLSDKAAHFNKLKDIFYAEVFVMNDSSVEKLDSNIVGTIMLCIMLRCSFIL
jgi:hypothetical protein